MSVVLMAEKAYMEEHKRLIDLIERTAKELQTEANRQKKEVAEVKATMPKSSKDELEAAKRQRSHIQREHAHGPSLGELLEVAEKKVEKKKSYSKAETHEFRPWTYDGEDYYKNKRGDVITTDYEWVGRYNGAVIDESIPEPADLGDGEVELVGEYD